MTFLLYLKLISWWFHPTDDFKYFIYINGSQSFTPAQTISWAAFVISNLINNSNWITDSHFNQCMPQTKLLIFFHKLGCLPSQLMVTMSFQLLKPKTLGINWLLSFNFTSHSIHQETHGLYQNISQILPLLITITAATLATITSFLG